MAETIIKARVTLVFRGYGDLTLTTDAVSWNKSATSFLMFGALNSISENHLHIPLSEITNVGMYRYVTGGLVITTNKGAEYKIGFKRKKDFNVVYDYLTKYINK